MKDYKLDESERAELKAIEDVLLSPDYRPSPDLEEHKKELKAYARNTLSKTRNINIRLTERDLHKLKVKAIEEGIPYQTLAASILHKAAAK